MDYRYAYLIGDLLVGLPLWLFLFVYRRDLRREMVLMSLFGGVAGLLSEPIYLRDYWRPETITGTPVGIEDFLFGFFIAGVASVVYEELFAQRYSPRRDRRQHWSWFALPLLLAFIVSFKALIGSGVNSIYASIVGFSLVAIVMLWFRRDLAIDSLASGLIGGMIFFVGYLIFLSIFPDAIQRWWLLDNLSGLMVNGIPVEELMWGFSWGAVAGPLYEFLAGRRLVRQAAERV